VTIRLDDDALGRLTAAMGSTGPGHERYRFDGEIARGGMGTVYRAWDRVLEREVAIKVLRGATPSPSLARRLAQEARILARLDHPGLIPVHDAGELDDGRAFYVMRLVRGVRLDEHLARTSSLAERLRLFLRIAEPVAFAHAHGVVHRDLKPANIMVGPYGEVLVLDWGIAKVRDSNDPSDPGGGRATTPETALAGDDSQATGSGAVLGTEGFMAPEQAAGGSAAVDERADVYALGAILGLMLEGLDRPAPRALVAVRRQAGAVRASDRYEGVAPLAADVTRFLDGAPVSAYRENPVEWVARFVGRHRTAVMLVIGYLLVRMALLAFGR
jgi:serine/threonine protein kinase